MLYLICYDVVSNKRRKKLSDLLLDFGCRVQKSAFECDLKTEAQLRDLLTRARRHVQTDTDSLRVYRVCGACRLEARVFGLDNARPVEKTIIL